MIDNSREAKQGSVRQGSILSGVAARLAELPRFGVLDTRIHAVDSDLTAQVLEDYLSEGRSRQVVTVNIDFLRQADSSPSFKLLINSADLAVPDGRPLVWMARYLGLSECNRVTGPDVIDVCASLSARLGYRMFLLGGEAGAAEQAKECLESSFPGAVICGAYSPPPSDYPFPEEIQSDIRERILEAKPHILFVAFGCPKQDVWIREHTESLGVIISVGIGGSFNFITGRVPRAPRLLQQCGLEWAFRLFREPRRLWRRYLRHDLPFVFKLLFLEFVRRLHLTRRPVLEVLT